MRYKVWVSIERQPSEEDGFDEPENEGLPDVIGEFEDLDVARSFVRGLPGWATPANLQTSDYRWMYADNSSCPWCGAGPPDADGELPHFRDCQEL